MQFLLQFEEPEIVEPVEEEPTPPKDVPPISDTVISSGYLARMSGGTLTPEARVLNVM